MKAAILFILAICLITPALATSLCTERITNGDFGTGTLANWTGIDAVAEEGKATGDYALHLITDDSQSASASQVINFTGVNYITFYAYADDPWGDTIGNLTIKADNTTLYDHQNIINEEFVPYVIDISDKQLTGNHVLNVSAESKYVSIIIDDISAISCYIIMPEDTAWATCDADAEAPLPTALPVAGIGIAGGAIILWRKK